MEVMDMALPIMQGFAFVGTQSTQSGAEMNVQVNVRWLSVTRVKLRTKQKHQS